MASFLSDFKITGEEHTEFAHTPYIHRVALSEDIATKFDLIQYLADLEGGMSMPAILRKEYGNLTFIADMSQQSEQLHSLNERRQSILHAAARCSEWLKNDYKTDDLSSYFNKGGTMTSEARIHEKTFTEQQFAAMSELQKTSGILTRECKELGVLRLESDFIKQYSRMISSVFLPQGAQLAAQTVLYIAKPDWFKDLVRTTNEEDINKIIYTVFRKTVFENYFRQFIVQQEAKEAKNMDTVLPTVSTLYKIFLADQIGG